jgi:hypothetical protein
VDHLNEARGVPQAHRPPYWVAIGVTGMESGYSNDHHEAEDFGPSLSVGHTPGPSPLTGSLLGLLRATDLKEIISNQHVALGPSTGVVDLDDNVACRSSR